MKRLFCVEAIVDRREVLVIRLGTKFPSKDIEILIQTTDSGKIFPEQHLHNKHLIVNTYKPVRLGTFAVLYGKFSISVQEEGSEQAV